MSTPMISSISPSSGPAAGGTHVAIEGSGLSSVSEADEVKFGDSDAASIVSVSDTMLVVVAPPASKVGPVAVSLVTPNGAVDWENAFDYEISVDSIYPAIGPLAGGTTLTVTGSGLLLVHSIEFDAVAASTLTVSSDTQLTVVTPAATAAGSVDISFVSAEGTTEYIEMGGFTYQDAAATSGGSPSTASAAGGAGSTGAGGAATSDSGGASDSNQQKSDKGASKDSSAGDTSKKSSDSTGKKTAADDTGAAAKDSSTPTKDPTAADKGKAAADGSAMASDPAKQPANTGGDVPEPTQGNYIPGGRFYVPGGATGLGGTDGTAQGFGVGTLMAGGGGSAAPSNLAPYVDPGLTAQIVQSLLNLVQSATSPDAIEAQNMILRRMALQGDLIGSRIPPPKNISEIGGYINLLDTLKEPAMREQALAGILGVAGPTVPLGWVSNTQPLSMVAVTNDRPPVAAQRSFPLTVLVRSDFVAGVQSALKTLHSYGATLPLTGPSAIQLPPGGTGAVVPQPLLYYLGRALTVSPAAALLNPAADPVAILQPTGSITDYFLAARVLNAATIPVSPADLGAVQCTPISSSVVQLNQQKFVPLGPILANAGYYSATPFPVPANSTQNGWSILSNTTDLVVGVTRLGDELSLLYRQDQIVSSALAAMLTWTWNGTTFAA